MFERRSIIHPWEGKMTPFKIIGNVYFCGTFQASCHLIDTEQGLILIDSGYSNTLYLVVSSIYELGFNLKDIKYIINTHWHEDHTEATRAMADLTGAKTLLGRYDEEKAKQYFSPDILIRDGDVLTLGNTTISFMETPGHTKGTISFTMVREQFDYAGCREGYRNSLHRLRKETVDVFIGNHVWNNNTYEYGKLLLETGENRFVDRELWGTFLDFCKKRLDFVIEKENSL